MADTARTARAMLVLDLATATPVGTLQGSDGSVRLFSGWMELASAIEAWHADARASESPAAGAVAPPAGASDRDALR